MLNRLSVAALAVLMLAACTVTVPPGAINANVGAGAGTAPNTAGSAAPTAAPTATPPATATTKPAQSGSKPVVFTTKPKPGAPAAAAAQDWVVYRSDKFGFQMAVPDGTAVADKDFGKGWGGVYAASGDAEVFGIANLGPKATFDEIEAFGVEVSGIPAQFWTEGQSGKDTQGWLEYRSASVSDGKNVLIAVYGHGPKGNYLLFLKTTVADLDANKADYEKFLNNVTLF